MKTNLENFKEYTLDKKTLSQINGGKSGHFIYKDGKMVWVESLQSY
ncbi:hypothetical protein LJC00_00315 [Dysgonomonas sp. OttesenSCG-928-M03]|nr:hypothetical protein [Dysgonomonas sp. OttesenSCG-928-M03]